MFADVTVLIQTWLRGDLSTGDSGELRLDIKGKGTEFLDVDTLASAQVVVQVSDERSPDQLHLLNMRNLV